jgi:cytochrome d ubiquinol oxidase subunit I
VHTWQGSFLAGAFLVLSVHAYYLRKGRYTEISKKAFKIALVVATVFSLSQLVSGHSSADGVAVNQPAKLAAMEGHFEKSAPADLYLLGWVDKEKQEVTGIGIPGGLSFLVHQDFKAPITGLNSFPVEDRPSQINAVFQFYHIMIAIGMMLIGLTLYASFLWWRGKLFETKWLLWIFSFAVILPQIANQVGWFAAEMGRQPWVVYGHLRTSEAFSQEVSSHQIVFSLIMFTVVYALLLVLFLYMVNKKIKHGPYDELNEPVNFQSF